MELEKDVESYLKREIKKRGGQSFKWTSTIRGVPDQIVCLPNGDTIFVELKKADGKTRKIQDKVIKDLRDLKQAVFVCHSRTEVSALVQNLEMIGCFEHA
ncbi:VRR-NUC domain-containing protein [Enterococcus timonensis]|uniref:VRR-NUC domain-containing protein n=1 Tax=Enterococcus timonensis TaxID=1852364 RepID=UPI0008DA2DE8|nr:VRR-NUC domain-containing protein [Enterococcus timonensis]